MEVKINKEIRDYTEHMFFGLSLRQLFFSVLAVIAGLVLYFLLKDKVGTETISWACIMGAFPFAAFGFIKYNGLTAEKFLLVWIRSELIMPKKVLFRGRNTYYELLEDIIRKQRLSESKKKECDAEHDENTEDAEKKKQGIFKYPKKLAGRGPRKKGV